MPECIVPSSAKPTPVAAVRAMASVDELREAFELRYDVYSREGWIAPSYDSTATRLELDGCDRSSVHLGLFLIGPTTRLVGYVRLITLRPQAHGATATAALVAASGDATLRRAYAATYPEGLPVFASFPLGALRRELGAQPLGCVELSRLIVHAEFRGCGFGARLVREALTVAATCGVDVVFLGCGLSRVRMFQRLGFDLLDTPVLNYQRIDQPSRALWRRLRDHRSQTGGRP